MTVRILHGDCRETLATLAPGSINCCVTSPPYWGLRDYGTAPLSWPAITYSPMPGLPACVEVPAMECCLGLEPTLEAFIGHIVLVFRAVRPVLRDDGTCWVNMGDCYAGGRRGGHSDAITGTGKDESKQALYAHQDFTDEQKDASLSGLRAMTASRRRDDEPIPRSDVKVTGLKPKDMLMQPARVALALQADGWWLRSDVIWHKPNPMPESTKDRPTKAHEYLFLLAKSERYYFDHDAIKEPAGGNTHARRSTIKAPDGWATHAGGHGSIHKDGREKGATRVLRGEAPKVDLLTADGAYADGKSERMGRGPGWRNNGVGFGHGYDENPKPRVTESAPAADPEYRAKRSVWTIPTHSFKEAHFATFPPDLIEPCIKAGCPEGGMVLDCFGGSGTTGLVADRLGRNAVLCELNQDYIGIAERRLAGDVGHVARQISLEAA